MSLVTAVSSSDITTQPAFESIFPVLSSEAEELIARIPSTSSPSHLVLRRRELAVNSHEYSATTMRLLVKAQGEVYPREVREKVPYFGGLQAVRKEISYAPPEPPALDTCRLSLPIPSVDRPHLVTAVVPTGVHKMCAGETRPVVCAGSQLDPGSPDGFDVTMIPQPVS
ncbi:hypothetical protein Pmar_PMAR026350 [Perkinsus marinus ATCC 50983]|uniref:Uncharacterized protein n=1 Tax=Perkinsus marinus (strain ATCC 50983 / TXsc) TaxID=423536 RepID=C5L4U4_PERM5|nr:hypothetical protein Pmar_PMAR026350 [Perkinsus marinus ATCC 50983]EER08249.1 hypothetical protein Pmar_PMAR026350 [Perkinsus marinus ATCC 50983]|eukprot:XP_002776433.1 hypothetical protein Pmar_PMAR026350 [Perkinsus marinus ATCC 50983]